MNSKTIIVAGLALALAATAALAQPPANPAPPAAREGRGGPDFDGHRGGSRGGPGGWEGRRMPRLTPEERAKRLADAFARMDANKDGRVTFEEFRQEIERRKVEREHDMFKRFSGGQDTVTLDQLKARMAERETDRGHGRDGRGPRGPGGRGPDQAAPPAR